MTENEQRDSSVQPNGSSTDLQPYIYRWSYAEQAAYDTRQTQKKRRNGIVVYAAVMTAVFVACLALLISTLIWYQDTGNHWNASNAELTTGEIAEAVKPATVLIYASNATGYGYGTGFIVRADGYIVTNSHVVSEYTNIEVTLYSGQTLKAELIDASEVDDIAVIKISGGNYPTVSLGNSDAVRVGDKAVAIGNPSGADASWTTTQGIISALDRNVTVTENSYVEELTMIQTDAPVNPGNSGGPLCNANGEVIGVVTRKLTDYEGIGLAIPINGVMEIANAIIETGSADGVQSSVSKVRPTIGIRGGTIKKGDGFSYNGKAYTAEKDGVIVSSVEATGGAYGALQPCDIIIAIDGKNVTTIEDLTELLYQYKIGDRVQITVWRDGKSIEVTVTLGKG